MDDHEPRSDEQLLAACRREPEAFAAFYRRHSEAVLAYFARRTRDPETAADLAAETFAQALDSAHKFKPRKGLAVQWLYGIAGNLLANARRRGVVEDRARQRLGMPVLELTDTTLERVERLADAAAAATAVRTALAALPDDQRDAVIARYFDERDYDQIAVAARCSAAVARKRVSRGLSVLRDNVRELS